jgi:hypothetical protein
MYERQRPNPDLKYVWNPELQMFVWATTEEIEQW